MLDINVSSKILRVEVKEKSPMLQMSCIKKRLSNFINSLPNTVEPRLTLSLGIRSMADNLKDG